MLDAIRKLIGDSVPGTPGTHSKVQVNDVRVAACALLVELACADGEFSAAEQARIMDILQRHFGVDEAGARLMLAEAAAANHDAVDHFVFTRQVVKDYDVAQRIVLAELMWQVAYKANCVRECVDTSFSCLAFTNCRVQGCKEGVLN